MARSGLLPTPVAQDAKNNTLPPSQIERDSLVGAVLRGLVPTPTIEGQCRSELTRRGLAGRLNPRFVEWMMGFPSGWTAVD